MLKSASADAIRIGDMTASRLSFLWGALFATVGLHLPYFPVWLASRGLPDTTISMVLAAPMILRVAVAPVVAYIADKFGIAATLAGCTLVMFAGYCGLGSFNPLWLIFSLAVLTIVAQTSTPSLADALTLSEIRRLEKAGLRRIDYGRVRVFGSISVLLIMLSSGQIVRLFPGDQIIWALALIALAPAVAGLVTAFNSRKLRLPAMVQESGLTADRRRLPLALVIIAAAALVQASHAQIYSFGTLHWKAIGLSPNFVGLAWATGVGFEGLLFFLAGRHLGGDKNAVSFLALGAAGAGLRWLAMSQDPAPALLLALQTTHALSFAATYIGSVLLLGALAGPRHRARMQGWLAAATSLSMAFATLVSGRLTSAYGEAAYLAMAVLAFIGFGLALLGGAMKRRLPP
jgi:MFS transporter, PPP family, 3-phenylpropionic acid transporter